MPLLPPRSAFVALLSLAGLDSSCRGRGRADGPAPTMVPTPAEGAPSAEVRSGVCARYAQCCQQVLGVLSASGTSAALAGCAQLATLGEGSAAEQACTTGLAQLSLQVRVSGAVVPEVCAMGTAFGTGTLGLFGGSSLFGGGGGGGAIALGSVQTGTFAAGDPAEADGSLYHDYPIVLAAATPVTLVARGGAATGIAPGGGSSTLDMYLILLLNGTEVTHDDDSAGNLNSRIVFTPATAGRYVIRVTTYGSGPHYGAYTLSTYPGALPSQS